jgi:hypothetical protein
MPTRSIDIQGLRWSVQPSGTVTQYDADEYSLLFVRGAGDTREVRVTRYSPQGSRSRASSLAELSDAQLHELFAESQPGATSPEAGYTT